MKKLLLIGCGGHCRSVIDVIEQEGAFKISGLVNKTESDLVHIFDYPIIGIDSDLAKLSLEFDYALITVGQIRNPKIRIKIFNTLKELGFILPKIISPRAYVSSNAIIGEGSIIMHDAIININASIGTNCIINTKTIVEHDSVIKDHCHLSTNVTVNGGVTIGEGSFIGSGSITEENIKIDKNSFIKAGSIIT